MSSKGKQKKKITKSGVKKNENCLLCDSGERDFLKLGKMCKYNETYAHYYCLLSSSGLVQNGDDNEGIFGFLEKDILKEFRRAEKLKCSYCRCFGATIGCSVKTCRAMFHLRCGLQNKALNQFYDTFESFCVKHRPRQTLDPNRDINEECPTCTERVQFDGGFDVLTTPCCHKLLHRDCLQKQALSAGYFFKCACCNDDKKFRQAMNEFGIFIPKEDASWEREPNAFRELYQRHSRCDQKDCECPEGPQFKDHSDWQILICQTCGSNGIHRKCLGRSDSVDVWNCIDCEQTFEKKSQQNDSINVSDSDSENDIEYVGSSGMSARFSRNRKNGRNFMRMRKMKRPRPFSNFKLPNNPNETIEIDVIDDSSEPEVKRTKSPKMKEAGIQCTLIGEPLYSNHINGVPNGVPNDSESNSNNHLEITKSDENIVIDIDSEDEIILD